jgi:hypothetical protein
MGLGVLVVVEIGAENESAYILFNLSLCSCFSDILLARKSLNLTAFALKSMVSWWKS